MANGRSRTANGSMEVADDVTVIFLHISKTAGSTLHGIFEWQYRRDQVYGGPVVRLSEFADLPRAERAKFRLIKGHMPFGIHEFVPNPFAYVTVLRNPVERVISHYYFVRRRPRHPLYARVVGGDMSLEEYVSSGISLELNNGQVRDLVGPEHRFVEYGNCGRDMLERAMHHMTAHFSVVGIAERFDESLLLLKRRLGWTRLPVYVSKNVSSNRPTSSSLPNHVIRTIERNNELDLELYAHAKASFEESVVEYDLGQELALLWKWNAVYSRFTYPVRAVRTAVKRWRRP